jgi:AraC family transcriptional activator FtrA
MPDSIKIMPNMPTNSLVVAVAYDGLCTFEFGCAVEVFGLSRPEMGPGWYRFAVAAVEPSPLRAAGGITIGVDGGLDLLTCAGTIVIPGWRGADAPVPETLCTALREAHAMGARILSLCSGAFVLAAAGLLDSKRATTHWRYFDTLTARHPDLTLVPDVLYVDEGSILTAAGSAAGLDLCLHLVRRDWGPRIANQVARRLVVPPHRDGGQAQYVERPVPRERASGSRLTGLLDRVRSRLDEAWPAERLATEAAVSRRGLHRRFRDATGLSPGVWLVAERVGRARELLEEDSMPIGDVVAACGFGTVATPRHHFRANVGISPAAYRARFTNS